MSRLMAPWRRRNEAGSMAIEVVILVPVMMMFTLLVVAGGRYVAARADIDAAARDAARAASLTRSYDDAQAAAHFAIAQALNSKRKCTVGDIDAGDFTAGGSVSLHLHCTLNYKDLGLLGVPGSMDVDTEGHAPIDTYRRTG